MVVWVGWEETRVNEIISHLLNDLSRTKFRTRHWTDGLEGLGVVGVDILPHCRQEPSVPLDLQTESGKWTKLSL